MSSPTVIVNSTPVVKVSYGLPGIGVPSGGVKPQVLKKSSSADYATEWGDVEVLMLDRTDLTFTGTLSKGDPVYINSSGQIAACDAADAATLPPVGLVAGDVTDPADDVDVILVGALIDANTATFSVGDRLYVAAGGGITATAPSGTDASYSVGVVSKVDSTEGIISVYVDGSNNTFEGLAQNQIWVGNANGVATQYTHQLSTLIDVDPSMSPSSGGGLLGEWRTGAGVIHHNPVRTAVDKLPVNVVLIVRLGLKGGHQPPPGSRFAAHESSAPSSRRLRGRVPTARGYIRGNSYRAESTPLAGYPRQPWCRGPVSPTAGQWLYWPRRVRTSRGRASLRRPVPPLASDRC